MPKKNRPTPKPALASDGGDVPRTLRLRVEAGMPAAPFGDVLRTARHLSRFTQVELAERMQVTQGHVAILEMARSKPTLETLSRYAEALGWELFVTFEPKKRAPKRSARKE
jgi:ribosome-binding protein aMBF1 (putative translation factor)